MEADAPAAMEIPKMTQQHIRNKDAPGINTEPAAFPQSKRLTALVAVISRNRMYNPASPKMIRKQKPTNGIADKRTKTPETKV